jgi:outer membrane protein OmpA-like peptidoglycan-associated protein
VATLRWTRRGRAAAALGLAVVLSACSGSATRVTLLPDQGGHVGAVVVGNAHGQQRIDKAYGSVEVAAQAAPRSGAGKREAFEARHRALLDAQPTAPLSFVLHFRFDSMELTAESKRLLPDVLAAVRGRLPTEVTVFGYADAAGTHAYNLALSAERARAVAAMLRKIDPELPVELDWFGDRSPLVPTAPGVAEPRNRRAEILIL